MAWGRKKSGGRKEPRFGPAASLAGLRLSPQDRIGSGEDEETQEKEEEKEEKKEKPKKSVSKSVSKTASKCKVEHKEGDDAPPPRERKLRESRSVSKRRSWSRVSMSIS